MDIKRVIEELHREKARIDEAIQSLERLQKGSPRRGRPPGWLAVEGGTPNVPQKKARKKPLDKTANF